jgi:hypothetical protein
MADTRDARLRRGDELWKGLQAALDENLDTPLSNMTDWTGHDVYAHFARWQEFAISELERRLARRPLTTLGVDVDALNMRWRDEDRALPTQVVRERCLRTREELAAHLRRLSLDDWQQHGRHQSMDVDGEHYQHHVDAIEHGPDTS